MCLVVAGLDHATCDGTNFTSFRFALQGTPKVRDTKLAEATTIDVAVMSRLFGE